MSTQSNPVTTQPDPSAAQQPQDGGFFSRLGAGLKRVMPYITPIANRLAAAAGNYGPIELEHQQRQQQMEQERLTLQQQLDQSQQQMEQERLTLQQQLNQSQLQNQELNRQLLQKQIANVRTPEEQQAAAIETKKAETPQSYLTPEGKVGVSEYDPATKTYRPRMITQQVPNPAAQAQEAMAGAISGMRETAATAIPRPAPGPLDTSPAANAPPPLMPPVPPTIGQTSPVVMSQKPMSGTGDVEADGNSPTGFSRVWRGAGMQELYRTPAPAPYAYVPQQTTSTVEQTGPTGLHEVNTTSTVRQPAGAGAPQRQVPPTRPPTPSAVNMGGPEARQLMDQNTTLDATNQIIDRIRASKAQFASMLDAGLITLATDPERGGVTVAIASRNLTPEQQKVAGDWQSLAEHINILRQPLGGTGFRSEEAWGALQAQRGRLTQAPGIIDQTLNNTQQILRGLRANNRRLLGPLDNTPPSPQAATGGLQIIRGPNGRITGIQ